MIVTCNYYTNFNLGNMIIFYLGTCPNPVPDHGAWIRFPPLPTGRFPSGNFTEIVCDEGYTYSIFGPSQYRKLNCFRGIWHPQPGICIPNAQGEFSRYAVSRVYGPITRNKIKTVGCKQ